MKILIIGFQRSGTSLTRRLFNDHPQVEKMLHEKRIINNPKALKNIEYKIWGDKVPWNRFPGNEIIQIANKWAEKFKDDYCIVHIMRNPKGSARSNTRLGWLGGKDLDKRIESSVKKVHNALKHLNYKAFRLEDLGNSPKEILSDVFNFCELDTSDEIMNKIVAGNPNHPKKAAGPILKCKLPPFDGYKEFI